MRATVPNGLWRDPDGASISASSQHSRNTPPPPPPPPPLSPTYTSPRQAPEPPENTSTPTTHKKPSSFKQFSSVFRRQPAKAPSSHSLRSAYTQSSNISDSTAVDVHPYATMPPGPLPVVSSRDDSEEEDECPVCLEPLSFSFRLPGEKPHIVPECGHALHEACFTAVYGPPPGQKSTVIRRSNLGVCGVCRRPMKVGDGDGGKSNKLAALTGMGSRDESTKFPGRESPMVGVGPSSSTLGVSSSTYRSRHHQHQQQQQPETQVYDPTADDPLDHGTSTPSVRSGHDSHHHHQQGYIVAPSIQVQAEFKSLTRSRTEPTQALTCIVIIELPSRRPNAPVPGQTIAPDIYPRGIVASPSPRPGVGLGMSAGTVHGRGGGGSEHDHELSAAFQRQQISSPPLSPPQHQADSHDGHDSSNHSQHQHHSEPDEPDPFASITEDLQNRIIDWKGHPLSGLGTLQMYDLVKLRRDSVVREFFVYLFREALICVVEERKKSIGRLLSSASAGIMDSVGSTSSAGSQYSSGGGGGGGSQSHRGVLRLKGRIYVRHIKRVTATPAAGEMSLTIDMEDERLDSFILIFRDRATLDAWKNKIESLVNSFHERSARADLSSSSSSGAMSPGMGREVNEVANLEEFGGSAKAMRMLSGASSGTNTSGDSSLMNRGGRSVASSNTSDGGSVVSPRQQQHHQQHPQGKLSPLGEEDEMWDHLLPSSGPSSPPNGLVAPYLSTGPSNSLTPLPHAPMDLILVVSLPPRTTLQSTAELKLRLIRTTLEFTLAALGARDRLSLVTFEVGAKGPVRKTPFLRVGKAQSKARLAKFIRETGARRDEASVAALGIDEFLVRDMKEEKTDVVTAVNHGLDVVLQRKAKNHISGLILVSDAGDSTRRAQMDLVLARAEAANVPIHSFGYGRAHDPASLWLMSNHTSGTYTFVRDWYDLKDCIAGCVGGMMSIGLLNMKLHVKIVDGQRFRVRKVSGGPASILASDGHDVDIEIGEVRYGERKEMLLELELDNTDSQRATAANALTHGRGGHKRAMNATEAFNASMGFDALALGGDDADIMDGVMDGMIDDLPVFEVDGSFYDPAAAKHISRLAHPVLLTITLMPDRSGAAAAAAGLESGNNDSQTSSPPSQGASDPVIVRRRMELLASDMITRALVLVSKKNFAQAQMILGETKRILHTVLAKISRELPLPNGSGSTMRSRREILTLSAVRAMQAVLQDLQLLSEALEDNVEMFAHDQRNFGAQQAMILRDQKSWSGRSATERLFWTIDHAIELVSRSADWVAREQ